MSELQLQPKANGAARVADFDAVIVGAGFAGVYMLHRLRLLGFSARVFEAGDGIGGTWFWNRYPGARCDVPSMEYSYQFSAELQQEWVWTELNSSQAEILRYINHVADRFDLRRDIQLNTRVSAATFDEGTDRWVIRTDDGACVSSQFCIMATGCLSSANVPDIKGLDLFAGPTYHTGKWPREAVDFHGKRVGVIGTGSSGIQAIPVIAQAAEHLFVFQRTPNYSVPLHNRPLEPDEQNRVKADYAGLRQRASQMPMGMGFDPRFPMNVRPALQATPEERQREFAARWDSNAITLLGAFGDLIVDRAANGTIAEFARDKIREIVKDPKVAELLSPRQTFGCKRLCLDSGYFETFNRPNVTLVDLTQSPIEEITRRGLRVKGAEYELDCIVFATGFDAMTGALLGIDIRGKAGKSLKEKWLGGPRAYLGVATAGFPNLFTITGPGSPSVLTNMLPSIEQHVNWIADCAAHLRERAYARIEPTVAAEDTWVSHVNAVAGQTLFPTCNSWYLGANVPGKPRVFMPYIGGFPPYVEKCNEVAAKGYEGFTLTAAAIAHSAGEARAL